MVGTGVAGSDLELLGLFLGLGCGYIHSREPFKHPTAIRLEGVSVLQPGRTHVRILGALHRTALGASVSTIILFGGLPHTYLHSPLPAHVASTSRPAMLGLLCPCSGLWGALLNVIDGSWPRRYVEG